MRSNFYTVVNIYYYMQSEEKKLLRFAAKMKAPSARSLGGKGFSEELAASNSASPRSWAFGSGPQICKCTAYGTLGAAQYVGTILCTVQRPRT